MLKKHQIYFFLINYALKKKNYSYCFNIKLIKLIKDLKKDY